MPSRTTRVLARTALAVVATAAVAGCSVYEDMTTSDFAKQGVADVVSASLETMTEVDSLRMTGQLWLKAGRTSWTSTSAAPATAPGSRHLRGQSTWTSGTSTATAPAVQGDRRVLNAAGGRGALSVVGDPSGRAWSWSPARDSPPSATSDDFMREFFDQPYGVVRRRRRGDRPSREVERGLPGRSEGVVVVTETEGGVATQRAWVATDESPHVVLKHRARKEATRRGRFRLAGFDEAVRGRGTRRRRGRPDAPEPPAQRPFSLKCW